MDPRSRPRVIDRELETDEAYSTRGIEPLQRDAAGVALAAAGGSSEDESRVGGAGTRDGYGFPSSAMSNGGAVCSTTGGRSFPTALGVLALLGLWLRRSRRRR